MNNIRDEKYRELLEELISVVNKIDDFTSNAFNASEKTDNFVNELCMLTRNYYLDVYIKSRRRKDGSKDY